MLWKRIKTQRLAQRNERACQVGGLLCSLLFLSKGLAQDFEETETVAPESTYISAPTSWSSGPSTSTSSGMGTSQLNPFGTLFSSGDPLAFNALLRWGPVHLRPSVTYRFTHSDGLQSRPGQERTTEIHEIIPSFSFQLGDHWSLNYSPTFSFYSQTNFEDTVDHSLSLNGSTSYESWSLGFSQSYNQSSSPLIETASQTDHESWGTSFRAGYLINSKTSLELGLKQNLRFVGDSGNVGRTQDSKEWSTMDWLNYQFWPKLTAGIGVGLGYVQSGTDMTYEQIHGRINWMPANKLSFSLSGGYEARQFLDSNEPTLFNPIMSAGIHYQVFETTSLSLNASRSVNASFFNNQVTESTRINLGLNQRLLGRLTLNVSGGIGTTTYQAASSEVTTDREDDYTNYRIALSMPVVKRGAASIFYSVSENSTDQSQFDYSSTQVGASFTYHF